MPLSSKASVTDAAASLGSSFARMTSESGSLGTSMKCVIYVGFGFSLVVAHVNKRKEFLVE